MNAAAADVHLVVGDDDDDDDDDNVADDDEGAADGYIDNDNDNVDVAADKNLHTGESTTTETF